VPDPVQDIYRRYAPMVLRRCRRLLGDEAAARDAMHDVFVHLLRRREPPQAHGLASLLYCIATRVCLNRMRTARRHPEVQDSALLAGIAAIDDVESSLGARALLGRLFGREPPSTREIAVLHLVDGMTLEEVARAVGLSVSGVRKRLRGLHTRLVDLTRDATVAQGAEP
jgi:RNA polymerase sigma factor (sigma-70 family)